MIESYHLEFILSREMSRVLSSIISNVTLLISCDVSSQFVVIPCEIVIIHRTPFLLLFYGLLE